MMATDFKKLAEQLVRGYISADKVILHLIIGEQSVEVANRPSAATFVAVVRKTFANALAQAHAEGRKEMREEVATKLRSLSERALRYASEVKKRDQLRAVGYASGLFNAWETIDAMRAEAKGGE